MQNLSETNILEKSNTKELSSKKLEGGKKFQLITEYTPAGDQPKAISFLKTEILNNKKNQVLLGVTGSGKTFTMAKIIEELNRPALILAPNKTLAAQLYGEMKNFFPNNAVEYFVSYYDYYTPEAYVPRSDTYIEKEASINEQIDRMRHSATRSLLERDDVIIVSSVSCIYGLGSVDSYSKMTLIFKKNESYERDKIIKGLVELQYKRNDQNFHRGTFRVRGENIEVFPSHYEDEAWRITIEDNKITQIKSFDPLTGADNKEINLIKLYGNSHYITPRPTVEKAIKEIKKELILTLEKFRNEKKLLEAQRLEERTRYDLEMIEATGSCAGIENYSRFLSGRNPGEPPPTLFEYLPDNCLVFVDESHVTIPQLNGMYKGDYTRKKTLSDYGFRLPSCMDNRPLKFEEWDMMRPQTIFVSATPSEWELNQSKGVFAEQIIRPTGLIDPPIFIRPAKNQVDDLLNECITVTKNNQRILVTTLTKKMAEDLTEYLDENGIKVRYMHSDIDTLERIEIIRDLRLGVFDVLIGINLLREGLDIPECALVAILDADKEGFLRSERSLIQTIGRAARNVDGKVILYADKETESIKKAINETNRRRTKQIDYNKRNKITAQSIKSKINDILEGVFAEQIIRPTGLIDPPIFIRPAKNQVDDLLNECITVSKNNQRILVTTLTKKMAEDLTEYLDESGIKVRYMHSDIDTLERIEIIRDLRLGVFDVLIGINLLREGLDIPECALVAILDADKEGFLRSERSLIQTIGRAARNIDGKVILYADKETESIKKAINETNRRRTKQIEYNKKNKITAQSIKSKINDILEGVFEKDYVTFNNDVPIGDNLKKHLKMLEKEMKKAAENLEFEQAAKIRDEIRKLQERELEINMSTKIKVYNDDVKKELIGRSTQGKAGMIAKKKR